MLRLKGSTDLSHIQIIKKAGGKLSESYLDEGFILDKKFGVNQPKRLENVKIMVANTAMDTDKIKIFGARVKVNIGFTGRYMAFAKSITGRQYGQACRVRKGRAGKDAPKGREDQVTWYQLLVSYSADCKDCKTNNYI